jgi:hypothetical protein
VRGLGGFSPAELEELRGKVERWVAGGR